MDPMTIKRVQSIGMGGSAGLMRPLANIVLLLWAISPPAQVCFGIHTLSIWFSVCSEVGCVLPRFFTVLCVFMRRSPLAAVLQ